MLEVALKFHVGFSAILHTVFGLRMALPTDAHFVAVFLAIFTVSTAVDMMFCEFAPFAA